MRGILCYNFIYFIGFNCTSGCSCIFSYLATLWICYLFCEIWCSIDLFFILEDLFVDGKVIHRPQFGADNRQQMRTRPVLAMIGAERLCKLKEGSQCRGLLSRKRARQALEAMPKNRVQAYHQHKDLAVCPNCDRKDHMLNIIFQVRICKVGASFFLPKKFRVLCCLTILVY